MPRRSNDIRWAVLLLGFVLGTSAVVAASANPSAVTPTEPITSSTAHVTSAQATIEVSLEQVIDRAHQASLLAQLATVQREIGEADGRHVASTLSPAITLGGQAGKVAQTTTIEPNCFTLQLPEGDWGDLIDLDDQEICLPPSTEVIETEGWSSEVTLSLRWVLWSSPLVQASREISNLTGETAKVQYDEAMAELTLQVVDVYYGVLQAEAAVRLLELALQDARLELEEREFQLGAGTATQAEYLQSMARVMELEGQLVQAQGALARARIALNHVAGYPLEAELSLERPAGAIMSAPTLWEALKAAEQRPDIRSARIVARQAEANRTITRAQSSPSIQLFGAVQGSELQYTVGIDRHGFGQLSVTHSKTELEAPSREGDDEWPQIALPQSESWMVGVRASLSLSDGGERAGQLKKAEAQAEAARLHVELLLSTVEAELRQAEAAMKGASGALAAARKLLDAMSEAQISMEEAFRRGAVSERSLSQVQLAKAQAEQAVLSAEYEYMKALFDYRRAAGLL